MFVRFPDPRIPLADRPTTGPGDWDGQYCGRTGSAATQPAWVAIYCGQEIQINDYQGDTQKTGSIYNFGRSRTRTTCRPPQGEWVDYEIRVEGQQYTVIRNGQVLNEFDNSIPLDSSRGGDPPTQARQFIKRLHRAAKPRRGGRHRLPQRQRPAARRRAPSRGRS